MLWFGSLIDIREFTEGGQDLYLRMAISELGTISLLFSLWVFLYILFFIFSHILNKTWKTMPFGFQATRQIVMLGKLGSGGVEIKWGRKLQCFIHFISQSRVQERQDFLKVTLLCFGLPDRLKKKRRSSKKKLVAIIVNSALLIVGMAILALVSYIWKKKLKTQGKFLKELWAVSIFTSDKRIIQEFFMPTHLLLF